MKTIKHTFFLIAALLTTILMSAEKVVLTEDNISALSDKYYYIVNTDINLNGRTLVLPKDAVVKFEGGSLYGTGTIDINGAVIVADSYPIFGENVAVRGQFGNDEVMAGWFGPMNSNTAAATIN